jgi:hypothetical protein
MKNGKGHEEKGNGGPRSRGWRLVLPLVALGVLVASLLQGAAGASPLTAGGANSVVNFQSGFSPSQRATLMSIAKDTWGFYSRDIDPATNLPMDNVTFAGGSATPTADGTYTSAAGIGVYLWAVAAAYDSR